MIQVLTWSRAVRKIAATVIAIVVWASVVSPALACPMCKAALASHEGPHGDLVTGFFWSILFMLSMPFAILGGFSSYMYVLVRRARAAQVADQLASHLSAEAPLGKRAPDSAG